MVSSIQAPLKEGAKYRTVRHISIYTQDLELLDTATTQWKKALNNDWIPFLLARDQKLIMARPWIWKDKEEIAPRLRVVDSSSGVDTTGTVKIFGLHNLIEDPTINYAAVEIRETQIPCSARSLGGRIDVTCDVDQEGTLVVQEYYWQGWQAWMDGVPIHLDATQDFLSIPAVTGQHIYQFRYRPWDAYMGMGVSFIGILICALLFFLNVKREKTA
jgi:hypothetical protein